MRAGAVATTIRIATRVPPQLKAGERVTVQVLKVLADGKWAVGLKGRVFPATSAVTLHSGDTLAAVVERAGRQIVLRLGAAAGDAAAATRPAVEALAQVVARAFLREGGAVDEPTLARARARVRSLGGEERKTARGLAVAAGKGIDTDSPGLDALFSLLHFEDNPERGKYRRRGLPRRESEQAAAVKGELAREGGDSSLSLFNALRPRLREQGTWVAMPFSFRYGSRDLDGTARFLYVGERPVRLSLEVRGKSSWGFVLSERAGRRRLQVFCDSERLRHPGRTRAALARLGQKLHNHGVEVDDSISDARGFDGYSAEPAGGGIDLLG